MSHYAAPPVPDWPLKSPSLPDNGAPTPPAFQPPPSAPPPPSSSPAWQGIRLPTTPSSAYHPFPPQSHHYAPYSTIPPHKQMPHRPTPLTPVVSSATGPMGEDDFRRQRQILSPQPRYPPGSSPPANFQHQPSRLELELLRHHTSNGSNGGSVPGFWSPQPGRGSFTSPPPGAQHAAFHSPPPSVPSTQGVTLPPKFMAKQSPSVTPLAAGLHPNHQASQLSVSLGNGGAQSSPGLLSIQTSIASSSTPEVTVALKRECLESSPTSTTTNVQDPHTSSSDERHQNTEIPSSAATNRDEDKEDGCHSTAASPPHVSTTRISPGNQDNSSTSATDTPNSILDDEKNDHGEAHNDCSTEPNDPTPTPLTSQANESVPMDTTESRPDGTTPVAQTASAISTQGDSELKQEPCDSAQDLPVSRPSSERPHSSGSQQLIMDVDGAPRTEAITPPLMPSTPTSQETASASALLSLSRGNLLSQSSGNNLNAALRIEERIAEEAMRRASGFLQTMAAAAAPPPPSAVSTAVVFSGPATVTRPPGLGPPTMATAPLVANFPAGGGFGRPQGISGFPGQPGLPAAPGTYQCPICGFTSTSKFHFNSHMNTHTDHQCTMCDYTARTEGRLKRHMEGHSDEEKMRAGVNHVGEPLKTPVGPRTSESSNGSQGTPEHGGGSGGGDESNPEPSPLERLQMQLNDTTPTSITASISSTPPSTEGGTPRRSTSSSKPKNYKCKQCEHVSRSKEESWRHARAHIKPDKILTCPQCEFVTEYKHHLEYHLRNHFGSKPFQCQKCHYSCVNKSMLNSHMKSHSQFYQFRCSDCTYATKYCHSLKLHLRKYAHRPATVIAADGTVIDPTQNLDLYGNRARNRQRQREATSHSPHFSSPSNSLPGDNAQGSPAGSVLGSLGSPVSAPSMVTGFDPAFFQQQHQAQASAMATSLATLGARLPTIQMPNIASLQMQMKQALLQRQQELQAQAANSLGNGLKCPQCDFTSSSKEELDKHVLADHLPTSGPNLQLALYEAIQARAGLFQPNPHQGDDEGGASPPTVDSPAELADGSAASSGSPISKGSGDEGSGTAGSHASDKAGSARRKGKARKLDSIARRLQECRSVENPDEGGDPGDAPKAPSAPAAPQRASPPVDGSGINWGTAFVCRHCRMAFMHEVMYQIHMGFHGYDNPFRCNRCGHESSDEVSHFMHIAQSKH